MPSYVAPPHELTFDNSQRNRRKIKTNTKQMRVVQCIIFLDPATFWECLDPVAKYQDQHPSGFAEMIEREIANSICLCLCVPPKLGGIDAQSTSGHFPTLELFEKWVSCFCLFWLGSRWGILSICVEAGCGRSPGGRKANWVPSTGASNATVASFNLQEA